MSGCCVIGCTNRNSQEGLKFYRIPRGCRPFQRNRRRLWLQAIQRDDWTEHTINNARVCGAHFVSGEASLDWQSLDFVPSVFVSKKQSKRPEAKTKRKRDDSVPVQSDPPGIPEQGESSMEYCQGQEDIPVPRNGYDQLYPDILAKFIQAQGRLKLEVGDLQDPHNGGRTTKDKKAMASLTPTGGKPPVTTSAARKSLFERSRCDTSLGLLTQGFAELLHRSADGVLDLNVVAQELNAPKRRVYDVTNVLEGVRLLKKKSKNTIQWLGGQEDSLVDELKSLTEEEKYLDELIQSCTRQIHQLCEDRYNQRYAYLTYEDVNKIPSLTEQTVIVIKAPPETNLEVPHPEESLQVHLRSTQGPIEVYVCSDDPVPMEVTDSSAANGKDSVPPLSSSSFTQVSSKDVANNSRRINNSSNRLSEQPQQSSPVIFAAAPPTPTTPSATSSSDDQHTFVALAPSLATSRDEEQYLLSLAEDEGITDLFSSVDLDQSPVDMPLV